MKAGEMKAVETVIEGNDGIHEWGYTRYSNGSVVRWMENLAARRELEAMLTTQRAKEPQN